MESVAAERLNKIGKNPSIVSNRAELAEDIHTVQEIIAHTTPLASSHSGSEESFPEKPSGSAVPGSSSSKTERGATASSSSKAEQGAAPGLTGLVSTSLNVMSDIIRSTSSSALMMPATLPVTNINTNNGNGKNGKRFSLS